MNKIWYKVCKNKKVNVGKLELVFRSSVDGWNRENFLSKLQNSKSNNDILLLIKTNFGRIIGAYAPERW